MRDIIWTIIVIWLIYKLIDVFKNYNKKSFVNTSSTKNTSKQGANSFTNKEDSKQAFKKSADKEGDYIDFEEIK